MAAPTAASRFATILNRAGDLQAPILFVIILAMLVVPMDKHLLDIFLVLNIGMALLILLRTTSVSHALEFSVFPSVLLITTLFRLALNISATRLILSSPDEDGAGLIIQYFGNFVIGANPVVGVIIFAILVIIQFVVITAGAGRVAEVAARFTLDAMPGKQMSIDADLGAGLITEAEAKKRRTEISREADFYGAMDGASKFVRGDAIAAIIMILVNIVGGFAVGMLQNHMGALEALEKYTLKTVGEGIVTQIPALIMSIATGLIVTRAGSETNLGTDLVSQVFGNARTLAIVAVIIGAMTFVPGGNWMLKIPFVLGAIALGGMAYYRWRQTETAPPVLEEEPPRPKGPTTTQEMMELLSVDPIEVEIGYGLIHLADPAQGGDLLERITALRKQIAVDMGFVVPPVRVRDNIQLKSSNYVIKLWNAEVADGDILPRHLLSMNPAGTPSTLDGIATKEPAFGLPAIWIPESQKLEAEMAGYTVVDPTTVLITHLSEVIKSHAFEVLTRQDAQMLIDKVRTASPALVDDLLPKVMSLSEVHRVLQNLLRERVPIRDMNRILSTLSDFITTTRDIDQLTEHVRQALARTISNHHRNADGTIDVFTLDPSVEQMMIDHLRPTQFGTQIVLDPGTAQKLLLSVKTQAERAITMGNQPIALCSTQMRPYFRRLVEKYMPQLTVLSHAEITPGVQVRSSGTVSLT